MGMLSGSERMILSFDVVFSGFSVFVVVPVLLFIFMEWLVDHWASLFVFVLEMFCFDGLYLRLLCLHSENL